MTRLRVASIVEGDGEVVAVPLLLRRLWYELLRGEFIDVLNPYHLKRGYLFSSEQKKLQEAVEYNRLRIKRHPDQSMSGLVLLLADRDPAPEPTCVLGPMMQHSMAAIASDCESTAVFVDIEFESWFFAAAPSLTEFLQLDLDEWERSLQAGSKGGKGWIQRRFLGPKYKETADQPRLVAAMDLALCRQNSPSFDKLCRELEKRL